MITLVSAGMTTETLVHSGVSILVSLMGVSNSPETESNVIYNDKNVILLSITNAFNILGLNLEQLHPNVLTHRKAIFMCSFELQHNFADSV